MPTSGRTRRRPEESEREILDAAERLLWERPLATLTVGELMRSTGLGRSSFYVYFRDLHDLAARLLSRLEERLWQPSTVWTDADGDPRAALDRAVRGVVAVWGDHGPVLRAIVEASLSDEHVHRLWREQLMERFIDAVAAGIEREIRAGRCPELPARETAAALLMMNERYLMDRLGTVPQHDADTVADALCGVWRRTLYG